MPVAVFVSPQQGVAAEAGGLYGMLWAAAPVRAMSEVGHRRSDRPARPAHPGRSPTRTPRPEPRPTSGPSDAFSEARTAAQLEASGLVDVIALQRRRAAGRARRHARSRLGDGTTTTLQLGDPASRSGCTRWGCCAGCCTPRPPRRSSTCCWSLGLGALAFEVFQPGFGVAGFAGLVMLPFAIFGLIVLPVTWWALALLLVGLVLFTVDAAMAGLGGHHGRGHRRLRRRVVVPVRHGDLRVPPGAGGGDDGRRRDFFVVVLTVILRAQAGPGGRRGRRPGRPARHRAVGAQPRGPRLHRRGPVARPDRRRVEDARRDPGHGHRRGRGGAAGRALRGAEAASAGRASGADEA